MLRDFLILVLVLLAGALAGMASVHWAADSALLAGMARVGAWRAWPRAGMADTLPYARLHYRLLGTLPPSTGERLEMVALRDDEGRALDADCTYLLRGGMLPVRYWLLALHVEGEKAPPRAFASLGAEDVIYEPDAGLVIGIASRPVPGNWLRAPRHGALRLVLHLMGLSPLQREKILKTPPFRIERKKCS